MKKILDKFKKYLDVNKKIFLFLSILLIIGITAGSIFSVTIIESDSNLVSEYLKNYLISIQNNEINFFTSFVSSSISDILIILMIWLLGLSVIGIPIIFIIFFYKSFIFGFTIGSILINYKVKGILLSIIYMLPHHVISLIILMTLITYAYIISSKIIKAVLKREKIDFGQITHTYVLVLGITTIIGLLLASYGSFIVPQLIKMCLPLFI